MTSEEALVGTRVRVREDPRLLHWRGEKGTIKKRWGATDYPALDVLFDDGSSQLFWHHELEEVGAREA